MNVICTPQLDGTLIQLGNRVGDTVFVINESNTIDIREIAVIKINIDSTGLQVSAYLRHYIDTRSTDFLNIYPTLEAAMQAQIAVGYREIVKGVDNERLYKSSVKGTNHRGWDAPGYWKNYK